MVQFALTVRLRRWARSQSPIIGTASVSKALRLQRWPARVGAKWTSPLDHHLDAPLVKLTSMLVQMEALADAHAEEAILEKLHRKASDLLRQR